MMFHSFESLYLTRFFSYDFEPIQVFQEFLGRYFKEVLFCSTGTQSVFEIEEIFDSQIKAQMGNRKQK